MGEERKLRYLKNHINDFMDAMEIADSVILAVDLEGTLIENKGFFDPLVVPDALLEALETISSNERFHPVILGVHTHNDMKDAIPLDNIILVSSASQYINLGGMVMVNPFSGRFNDTFDSIEEVLDGLDFHRSDYMMAIDIGEVQKSDAQGLAELLNKIRRIINENNPDDKLGFKLSPGTLNIYDVTWTKADALNLIVGQMAEDNITMVYFGDDQTDEPAFEYTNRFPRSWSVVIMRGKKRTMARYYLRNVDELSSILIRLAYVLSASDE